MSGWFKESLEVYHIDHTQTRVEGSILDASVNPFVTMVSDIEEFEKVHIPSLRLKKEEESDSTNCPIDIPCR
jgi:hypothetical protein